MIRTHVVLSPLPINEAGLIRARVLIGEKLYPLGTLRVEPGDMHTSDIKDGVLMPVGEDVTTSPSSSA